MNIRSYLTIGLKLLGVYFAVLGFTTAVISVLIIAMQTLRNGLGQSGPSYSFDGPIFSPVGLSQSLTYLLLWLYPRPPNGMVPQFDWIFPGRRLTTG